MPSITLPTYHAAQQRVKDEAGRFNVLFWGRQTGKTTFCKSEVSECIAAGGTVEYFTPTRKYLTDVFRELAETLRPITVKCDRQEMRIETMTGGVLDAWSLKDNPDAGRGRVADMVVYEEAGLVANLKRHFNETARACIGVKEGVAWFNGNARPRGDFNDLFHKGQRAEDGWRSWRIRTEDNPYFPAEELARIRAEYKREGLMEVFRQEYEAIPMRDLGSAFAAWHDCVGPMSEDEPVAWGWDLAEEEDHTIGIALDRQGRVCRIVDTKRDGAKDWQEIEDVVYELTGACEASVDATGVGKPVYESLARRASEQHGDTYEGFKFTSESKQALYGGIRSALRKGDVTVPEGPLTDALNSAEYVVRETQLGAGVSIWVPRGIHKDHVDAFGLALRAYWRIAHRHPAVLAGVQDMPSGERLEQLMREERERIARIRGAA